MSWSRTIDVTELEDLRKVELAMPHDQHAGPEASDQLSNALEAAAAIISSGAVGESPWRVMLGGHANPDHMPAGGWAEEMVSIQVLHLVPALAKVGGEKLAE
jgi:hypothetical protein